MRTVFSLRLAVCFGLAVAMTSSAGAAVVFLQDDFEYADDAAMAAAGWQVVEAGGAAMTEVGGEWKLMTGDHSTVAAYNPPTLNGSPGTGKFIGSDSYTATGLILPDTGASHDLVTKSFSTTGNSKVWLHADVNAILNQDGKAVFDIEVSTDGGASWNNVFQRISPGRNEPIYISDPPVTTFLATNDNADGFHGRLDVNISQYAANKSAVKVRFRHYEPHDDWWVKMDNLVVDNQPIVHGLTTIYAQDFNAPTGADRHWVGDMITDGYYEDDLTWVTWGTGGVEDGRTTTANYGKYVPVEYTDPETGLQWRTVSGQRRQVNRLEHTPRSAGDPNPNPNPDFAIIDCNFSSYGSQQGNEYLMTPLLDLSNVENVRLGYEDEIWWYTKGSTSTCKAEVLLMRDNDDNGPDSDDEVVKVIFKYDQNSMGQEDPVSGEDPWYANRLFEVPEAQYSNNMFFAWHYEAANAPWWAIDSIKVSGEPSFPWGDANCDFRVDDQDAAIVASNWQMQSGATWRDGDFNGDGKVNDQDVALQVWNWHYGMGEASSVPEPSTLVMLLAAAATAWLARRFRLPG